MPPKTTPASVSEFFKWVGNDWTTQPAAEAAKTTYGEGTSLASQGKTNDAWCKVASAAGLVRSVNGYLMWRNVA
jgi:hypothetical protein